LYYPDWGQTQYGAYATLRVSAFDRLHLTGGVRDSWYRFHKISDVIYGGVTYPNGAAGYASHDVLTPYGGLVYDLTKEWSVYGSYTSIFQPQSEYLDRSLAPLPPITGTNYEAGVKAELLDRKLDVHVAGYYTDRHGTALGDSNVSVVTIGTDVCCYVASGEVISKGVDVEITGKILPGWQLATGYTFNENYFTVAAASSVGAPNTTLSPKHLFKLWTTYELPGALSQWTLGFGATAQSTTFVSGTTYSRFNADGTPVYSSATKFSFVQGGYAVFSARIGYQIDKNWSAALNINNIFDRTYYQTVGSSDSGNWYGAPRNFMLTVRGKW
jgi:outer membrane receptor for ferric coprogen and ferric-rhodotorulic acid